MKDLEEIFQNSTYENLNDKDLIKEILSVDLNCTSFIPEELRKNEEIRKVALKTFGHYECSRGYSKIELSNDENFLDVLLDYDFKEEPRILDFVKELEYGYKSQKEIEMEQEEDENTISLANAIVSYDIIDETNDDHKYKVTNISPFREIIEIEEPEKEDNNFSLDF